MQPRSNTFPNETVLKERLYAKCATFLPTKHCSSSYTYDLLYDFVDCDFLWTTSNAWASEAVAVMWWRSVYGRVYGGDYNGHIVPH